MSASIRVAVYQARTAKSAKTGNDYIYQQVEIQQSPERPNAQFRRFYKSMDDALEPGLYDAKVAFYIKDNQLTPTFFEFKKAV